MPDWEKVIKGLKCCLTLDSPCGECPYYSFEDIHELDCERNLRNDAITLLKEQDAVDAVPVVRCKDCAKREICRTSTVWAVPPNDYWYCADGERKDGEQHGTAT